MKHRALRVPGQYDVPEWAFLRIGLQGGQRLSNAGRDPLEVLWVGFAVVERHQAYCAERRFGMWSPVVPSG